MRAALLSFSTKGGAGQYPAQLANGISQHARCYSLVPTTHSETEIYDSSVELRQFETEKYRLSSYSQILKYPSVANQINNYLTDINPDIVHLPAFFHFPSILAIPIIKYSNIPVVATVHNPRSHGGDEVGPCGIDTMGYLRMLSSHGVDRVVVHGQRTYDQANSMRYPAEKLRIIPHGMYDHFGRSDGGSENSSPINILFFGHLNKYRGTDRLHRIAEYIREDVEHFQITVAGPMGKRDSQWGKKTIKQLKSDKNILVRDEYIPQSEVSQLFESASIVLLPYYDATMSGVVMTAYSFATPIVATDTGDMGWMIRQDKSGLLANENTDKEIARQVCKLIESPKLRNQIRQNILKSRDKYSWSNIGRMTVQLYQELV